MRAASPLILCLSLAWLSAEAAGSPYPLHGWRLEGAAVMRFLGRKVYDIRLWHPGDAYRPDAPFALELEYGMRFKAEDIVARTIAEMRAQGVTDEVRLARWRAALLAILPDVRTGDRLLGVAIPNAEARFYSADRHLGTVADPAFVAAFFAIWLSEKTSAPQVRQRLLTARE